MVEMEDCAGRNLEKMTKNVSSWILLYVSANACKEKMVAGKCARVRFSQGQCHLEIWHLCLQTIWHFAAEWIIQK